MPAAAEAYSEFLDHLREAGDFVATAAADDRERAEGYRHLTRLTSIALEMFVERGSTSHPEFTRWMNPHRKMMGDNPRTIYESAWLDPSRHYVIRGRRGGTTWLGICLYGTGASGSRRIAGAIEPEYDEAGNFEIHLASQRPDGLPDGAGWLAMDADVTDLLVRQYFHDPLAQAEATYSISCGGGDVPGPLDETTLAARLRAAGGFVRETIEVETTISAISATTAPPEIRKPGSTAGFGEVNWDIIGKVQPAASIGYAGAWFDELDDEEMIVAEGVLPECVYASAQWISKWMESGDYAHHQVFLTDREMDLGPDRRFRITLAHSDPGDGPWLDTTGIRNGTFVMRTLGAEPAEITFTRVRR